MVKKLAPIHPGEVLAEEFLRPMSLSQNRLALDIRVPARRINEIVQGKRRVSPDTALRLARSSSFSLLTEAFESVHGIFLDRGTSLFETLADITAEEASRATSGRCATLAAQVNHVRFYLDVLEEYMLETRTEKADWASSWQVGAVTEEEWARLKEELQASYRRVRATMEGFDSWDNDNRVGGALAIVVHTAHHLGEIRQMLCGIGI